MAGARPRWPKQRDQPTQQIESMRRRFPQFDFRALRDGGLEWRGSLQPTPESPVYPLRIVHERDQPPKVLLPQHHPDQDCGHLYSDGSLCLYWPKEWRWTARRLLAETIVPWAAFWLYYYELWQTTGKWFGPSSPHAVDPGGKPRE